MLALLHLRARDFLITQNSAASTAVPASLVRVGTLHESLTQLARHGYVVLFVWVTAEQIGLPIPAVPILLAAGVLSALGQLTFSGAFALGILACVIGDTLWYAIGKWKGTAVLKTLCRVSFEPESCVRSSSNFITRWGPSSLAVAKFIPGIGAVAVPLVANSKVPLLSFVIYDLLGAIFYIGAYLGLGWLLGGEIDRLNILTGTLKTATAGFAAAGTVAILAWRFHQRRRFLGDLRMSRIAPDEVLGMINNGDNPFIIDLRHPLDFLPDPRVIPGAVRMTPDEVTARRNEIPLDREIIVYCT